MDIPTLITTLSSLAAIIAVLYAMLIGQKSLLEWWRENHPPVIQEPSGSRQNPPPIAQPQTTRVPAHVPSRNGVIANLQKLWSAWRLYKQARVEVHPDFYRLLVHLLLRFVVLLVLIGGPVLLILFLLAREGLRAPGGWGMGATSTPASTLAPGIYKIIVASEGEIDVVECGEEMQLTSNERIRFRISSNRAGEPKWQSLAQDKVVREQIFAYTPGEFIDGEYDIISYYSDGVMQCSLRLLRARSP